MVGRPSRATFRTRLSEMISVLRDEIVTGKRQPGEHLPSEMALAEQFSLSKNSVRKGLEVLVNESLIEKLPRVGNRVCNPAPGGTVIVRFGYYPSMLQQSNLLDMLEGFYSLYPNIRVQLVPIHYYGFHESVPDYFETEMLDLVTINQNNFQHCIEGDRIQVFEALEANKHLYPFFTRAFMDDGTLRALPFAASPVILCYNKDHFLDKGIPEPDSSWTWDDLMRYTEQLNDGQERHGFHFHLLSDNRWPIFLLQSGAFFQRDNEGMYNLTDDRLWEGLELSRTLAHAAGTLPAYFSENDADTEALFLQGKISAMITTYFSLNSLKNAGIRYELAPLPYNRLSKTLLLVIGLAVNKHSKVKEAAMTLANYLLSYDVQLSMRQNSLTIPSHKAAAEWSGKETMYRPAHYHMYRDIVPTYAYINELGLPLSDVIQLRNECKPYWSLMEDRDQLLARLHRLFHTE